MLDKYLIFLLLFFSSELLAGQKVFDRFNGVPYKLVKPELIKEGWRPFLNLNIQNSSLFAQDVYNQGFTEVMDCVSMERDGCHLRFKKGKRQLIVETHDKNMIIESFRLLDIR